MSQEGEAMASNSATTKLCYVIMPFSKTKTCSEDEWTDIFQAIIKPAVEGAGLGYRCLRSEATTGNIIKKVINSLYQANIVVADLTDRNPNVFYELGVRHTLKTRTIMIAQRRKDIPSDLDGYASHVYKWKTTAQKEALEKKLRSLLDHIEEDVDRPDNPVSDFLHERSIRIFEFQREENSRKLRALRDELDRVLRALNGALERAKKKGKKEGVSIGFLQPCPAIDHLIATQYVYNDTFSFQAGAVRSALAIVSQAKGSQKLFSETVMPDVEIFKRNAEKLLAAYEAGDPLDKVKLEEFPDSGD